MARPQRAISTPIKSASSALTQCTPAKYLPKRWQNSPASWVLPQPPSAVTITTPGAAGLTSSASRRSRSASRPMKSALGPNGMREPGGRSAALGTLPSRPRGRRASPEMGSRFLFSFSSLTSLTSPSTAASAANVPPTAASTRRVTPPGSLTHSGNQARLTHTVAATPTIKKNASPTTSLYFRIVPRPEDLSYNFTVIWPSRQ